MSKHYIKVTGGSELVIDLGGYGLHICLDKNKKYYDIEYITIPKTKTGITIKHLPADMVVAVDGKKTMHKQADCVRIWRHER